MNSAPHPPSSTISALAPDLAPDPAPDSGPGLDDQGRLAVFDPALHAAAVAAAGHVPGETPLMAAGWWSTVVAPEDPRALELRHLPGLPAADAARVRELFAEVVDSGGACAGDAWEVLTLWELGSSPSATAAANAVMILICRGAEADEAAGHPAMPWWIKDNTSARIEKLLGD